ncbi:MAG: hypoxanthine phosphoribosyltransferase [Opitutales bacterium]|nr:hypoxanthine phosphoribosyltransferase [Opitutales bacterium]
MLQTFPFPVPSMLDDLHRVLVSQQQLQKRVEELGQEITEAYREVGEVTVVAIINGAIVFAADLIRHIGLPLRLDCLRVSSYRDDTKPASTPEIIDKLRLDLKDRHVLLIDDIMDTGRTSEEVVRLLREMGPASIKVCVLLEKKGRREVEHEPDYVGFQIPDDFAVGYGLDFAEHYRNLPCIGVLRPEAQNPPEWR